MLRFHDILDTFGLLDFRLCPVADEDRFASPFDDHVLSFGNRSKIDLDLGLRQDVG